MTETTGQEVDIAQLEAKITQLTRGRIVNIQEIITLIRSGSSNPDHLEGQRQIEEAIHLLGMLQSVDGLLFSQRYKLSKILDCKCNQGDIEKAVEKAVVELKEARSANQWQPIETAPKDGTSVLFGHWQLGVFTARFVDGKWQSPWDGKEIYYVEICRWQHQPALP